MFPEISVNIQGKWQGFYSRFKQISVIFCQEIKWSRMGSIKQIREQIFGNPLRIKSRNVSFFFGKLKIIQIQWISKSEEYIYCKWFFQKDHTIMASFRARNQFILLPESQAIQENYGKVYLFSRNTFQISIKKIKNGIFTAFLRRDHNN